MIYHKKEEKSGYIINYMVLSELLRLSTQLLESGCVCLTPDCISY